RALDEGVEEALAAVLEESGLPRDGEVCVRDLHVPVRLRLSAGEDERIRVWSAAFARALAAEVRDPRSGRIVIYRSRRQALADLGRGAAAGDLRRAWAWTQLGLGPLAASAPPRDAAGAPAGAPPPAPPGRAGRPGRRPAPRARDDRGRAPRSRGVRPPRRARPSAALGGLERAGGGGAG